MSQRPATRLRGFLAALLSAACLACVPAVEAKVVAPADLRADLAAYLPAGPATDLPGSATAAETETLLLEDADGNLYLASYAGQNPYNGADVYALSPLGLAVWTDREDDVDKMYQSGHPVKAFFYDFGVRAWNGFSFGMLSRQAKQEDAIINGDISMGRYAAGATVNASISGAQLALSVGGIGQVATATKGAATLLAVARQGANVGGKIGLISGTAEALGTRLSDAAAGVTHDATVGQDVKSVAVSTVVGASIGTVASSGTYGAVKVYAAIKTANVASQNAAAGSINLMDKSDQFLVNAANRTDVDANGVLDVVAHGNSTLAEVNGQLVNHRVLAQIIRNNPQFVGQDIRLLSCSTGELPTGFAQNLANKLGVRVKAPSDILWAFPNGRLTIGPRANANTGSWMDFVPGGNQ